MAGTYRKYYYVFESSEVDSWKQCPKCGGDIIEVYPGNHSGHITCERDFDEDIRFKITWEDE